MSIKTHNFKTLAAEAGISTHILRLEREKLFTENPELKEKFGSYSHRVLTSEQVEILVTNIPHLKSLSKKLLF